MAYNSNEISRQLLKPRFTQESWTQAKLKRLGKIQQVKKVIGENTSMTNNISTCIAVLTSAVHVSVNVV